MLWTNGTMNAPRCALLACLVTGLAGPVAAQDDIVKLSPPAPEYTLGRFRYEAPQIDGWRQIANNTSSLSLIYAEQKGEEQIETLFGATLEVHEVPDDAKPNIPGANMLAELSRQQMAEARKDDLVGQSPIEAVPSLEDVYTYRLLVHAPVEGLPDAYEVYYVAMAPDKSQYVVIQCITRTADYGDSLYFNQFYGSLASLRYIPAGEKPAEKAAASGAEGAAADAKDSAPDAGDAAPAAGSDAPATPPAAQ